jgi:hypothetical protein
MKKFIFAVFALMMAFQVSAMACGLDGHAEADGDSVEEEA